MDSDLDSDLRHFKMGGFDLDLDLKFAGFDLKKIKSTPNPSLVQKVNLVTQQPSPRCEWIDILLETPV